MVPGQKSGLHRIVFLMVMSYLVALLAWYVIYLILGDGPGYLGLVNMIALYLFIPLILVFLLTILLRSKLLLVGTITGIAIFISLWGYLFFPLFWSRNVTPGVDKPALKIMTYNVLAWHNSSQPVIKNIQMADADIIFLQELNNDLANVMREKLFTTYPYQELVPANNPAGMGVISKHPMTARSERLPDHWIGGPQILDLKWHGIQITLVNFHMYPSSNSISPGLLAQEFRIREAQAKTLADFARRSSPIILAGDANATTLNTSFKILTSNLESAWDEAGIGTGHTWPGNPSPESNRPRIGRFYFPTWIVRIDHILYSEEFKAAAAAFVPFDGVSDHRGIIAVLVMVK